MSHRQNMVVGRYLTQYRWRNRRVWRNGRVLHNNIQHYSPSIASGTIFVHIIKKLFHSSWSFFACFVFFFLFCLVWLLMLLCAGVNCVDWCCCFLKWYRRWDGRQWVPVSICLHGGGWSIRCSSIQQNKYQPVSSDFKSSSIIKQQGRKEIKVIVTTTTTQTTSNNNHKHKNKINQDVEMGGGGKRWWWWWWWWWWCGEEQVKRGNGIGTLRCIWILPTPLPALDPCSGQAGMEYCCWRWFFVFIRIQYYLL